MSGNIRQKYNDFSKTKHGNTHRLVHGNTLPVKILRNAQIIGCCIWDSNTGKVLALRIVRIVSRKIVNIIVMQDFHI